MSFFARVKRASKLPPHILAKKIIRKSKDGIKNTVAYIEDHHLPYQLPQSKKIIDKSEAYEWTDLKPPQTLAPFAQFQWQIVNEHKFDLLATGYVSWAAEKDPEKKLLSRHLTVARELRAIISKEYKYIDWQKDVKTGYRWDVSNHFKKQHIGSGCDIKLPWELSRFQHWPQLAALVSLLPEEHPSVIVEFKNQILDFIAHNPVRFGANWVCPMDIGIRAANILLAYDMFKTFDEENTLDEKFSEILTQSMLMHGRHIMDHLEYAENVTSNHYLSNVAGMAFLSEFLPQTNEVLVWRSFAIRELETEMFRQVQEDGSDFEASTSYHRLVGELFVYTAALLMRKTGSDTFSKNFWERLFKMGEFTKKITKHSGEIPQIGDNDSGRFFKFTPVGKFEDDKWVENGLDHSPFVSALSALFFGDAETLEAQIVRKLAGQTYALPCSEEQTSHAYAESAVIPKTKYQHVSEISSPNPKLDLAEGLKHFAFPDFGLYVFKSEVLYLAISCGHNGQNGLGGHAHNDKLSFELQISGQDLIVDPGTGVYTPVPEIRNKYRATAAHSTILMGDEEQNPIDELTPFLLEDRAKAECLHFKDAIFIGKHSGFSVPVYRKIEIKQDKILVTDYADKPVKVNFNMPFGNQNLVKGANVVFNSLYSSGYGDWLQ